MGQEALKNYARNKKSCEKQQMMEKQQIIQETTNDQKKNK